MNTNRIKLWRGLAVGLLALLTVLATAPGLAQTGPDSMNFQGRLLAADGKPRDGESHCLRFRICNDGACTTRLWPPVADYEYHLVTTESGTYKAGLFTVALGASASFTPEPISPELLQRYDQLYLEIGVSDSSANCAIASYETMLPRSQLRANAYAQRARRVRTTEAEHDFYLVDVHNTGSMGAVRGEADGSTAAAIYGRAWSATGATYGVYGQARSPDGYGGYFENLAGDGIGVEAGANGLYVSSAGDYGLLISAAGNDGVFVYEAGGAGLAVSSAGTAGVIVYSAVEEGVRVHTVGSPSASNSSPLTRDGVEVQGAQGYGLFVGRADLGGVWLQSTGGDGVHVYSAGSDGFEVEDAEEHGLYVGWAGEDGVRVQEAGDPSAFWWSSPSNGVEVGGAEGNGLYVGRADDSGVWVNSAGWDGLYVEHADRSGVLVHAADSDGVRVTSAGAPSATNPSSENNGLEVEGAEGYGLFIGSADLDGVHVAGAGGYAGYFGGDVRVVGTLSKGAGSFQIDHPLDPQNKYLSVTTQPCSAWMVHPGQKRLKRFVLCPPNRRMYHPAGAAE